MQRRLTPDGNDPALGLAVEHDARVKLAFNARGT
jgi:hypothetical protein